MLEHLHAGDAGHAEIGDDEMEAAGLDDPHRRLAAVGRLDLIALLRQQAGQGQPHALFVVDDEDASLHDGQMAERV